MDQHLQVLTTLHLRRVQSHVQRSLLAVVAFVVAGVSLVAADPASSSPDADPATSFPPGEPRVFKRVEGRELRLHLYKSADWKPSDRRPALMFFHGGSFTSGTPDQFARHAAYFADRGLVTLTVEYRLLLKGDDKHSELPTICVQDAKSAMRWVRVHAAELGIDEKRLGAAGGSAGGYLAAFVALGEGGDAPDDDLKISTKPAVLVLFNPVVGARPGEEADLKFDRRFGPQLHEYLENCPANRVSSAAPPTIIFHGTADPVVPVVLIQRFETALKNSGVRCEAHYYEGQSHGFFNPARSGGKYYDETVFATDKFLVSLGWLEGVPTLARPRDRSAVKF